MTTDFLGASGLKDCQIIVIVKQIDYPSSSDTPKLINNFFDSFL